jgi:hypothetical protein
LEIIAKVAEHNLFEKSDQDRAYTIINILIHPSYDPIKNDNDIALLKINGTFPCNNNNVKPVMTSTFIYINFVVILTR